MLPDGWSILPISEILERVSDPIFPKPEENYYQIGIRSHGKGIFHKKPVTGESLGNKRVFRVHPDCFVVNIVFAWEQAIAKTSTSEVGRIASHRFPMFRPKNNLCDVDYLTYLFKTPKGKYLLGLASPGGAGRNKTLGQNEFSLLKLTLPPIMEQQKTSQILSTWDKAIENLEALIAVKQKRKKALMQQLLTGNMRLPGFSGEWTNVMLSNLANVTMGSSPKSDAYNEDGVGLPLIQGNADIKNRLSAPRIYTAEITKECKPKDILMSVRAPVGAIAISIHHACIGRGICAVTAIKSVDQQFLYHWLLAFEPKWASLSQGSTFESVNSADVKSLIIYIPIEKTEQQKIATVLSAADQEITVHKNQLTALKQQKTALMQQLLTGKVRVKLKLKELSQ
ncbi:MAG: restriction endonuclease subunit S [Methylococcaceae bacterium]